MTRLVLGWLAGKRSENTRTAYARDIGITPRRRGGSCAVVASVVQEVMGHADPRTTRRYDRERQPPGRSPGDLLAAYLSTPSRPAVDV